MPSRKNNTEDEQPTKVASTEVSRPLSAREIRKNEALSDSVRYARLYHTGRNIAMVSGLLVFVCWFLAIWTDSGDLGWSGALFLILTVVFAGLSAWAHELWKGATKTYLNDGAPTYGSSRYY